MPTFSTPNKPLGLSSDVFDFCISAVNPRIEQSSPRVYSLFPTYSSRNRSENKPAWIASRNCSVGALFLRRRSSVVYFPRMKRVILPGLVDDLQSAGPVRYGKMQGGDTLSCTIYSPSIREQNVVKSANTNQKLGPASVQIYPPTGSTYASIPFIPKSLSRSQTLQMGNLRRLSGFGSSIIHLNSVHLSRVPAFAQHFHPPVSRSFSSKRDESDVRKIIELAKKLQKSGTSMSALWRSGADSEESRDIINRLWDLIQEDSDPVQAGKRAAMEARAAREAGRPYERPGGPTKMFRRRVAELRRLLEDDSSSGRNRVSPDQRKAFEAMLDSVSSLTEKFFLGLRLLIYGLVFYFLVLPISRRITRPRSTRHAQIGKEIDSEMKDELPLWQQEDESQL